MRLYEGTIDDFNQAVLHNRIADQIRTSYEGYYKKKVSPSDEDLWWIFVHHRKECSSEFWQELKNRKAADTLSESSPFWAVYNLGRHLQKHAAVKKSNLIALTREEW